MGSEDFGDGAAAAAAAASSSSAASAETVLESQNGPTGERKKESSGSLVDEETNISGGDDGSPQQQQQQHASTLFRWSDALASPRDRPIFSPSREVKEGHHGWAMLACLDRARQMTRCSRRTVSLLLDVTQTYDQFAQALLKAGQSINPLIATYNPAAASSRLQESMVFWSGETSRLSSILRTEIAVPLQNFLNTTGDSIHASHEKYLQSRYKSCTIRQRTIRARTKYVKVLREAEQAFAEWKKQSSTSPVSAAATIDSSRENLPASLTAKLKLVERRAAHYKGLAEWENECITQCELLETFVLETLQKLEEDRILHFSHSIGKALTSEKQALTEIVASMLEQDEGSTTVTASANPSPTNETTSDVPGMSTFKKIRRSVSGSGVAVGAHQYDEGSGLMDAETLGLPLAVGKLRDTIRNRVQSRSTRVQAYHMMSRFLEYVISALERFSAGMKQIVRRHESSERGLESVYDELKGLEKSDLLYDLLGKMIQTLATEADQSLACAKNLKKIRGEKLEAVVLYGSKLLKAASDSEELSWKKMCDAARSRTKAEDRYRQTAADSRKVRDRATSVDSAKTSSMVSKQVSKSLANMFSVLPNRGEHAMKILAPGTVASIVQHTLEEADEKESKGKQELDSAVDTTEQLVSKYRKNALKWIAQFDTEDQDGWGDLKPAIDSFSGEIEATRNNILTTLDHWTDGESLTTQHISESCGMAVKQCVSELLPQLPSEVSAMVAVSDDSHQTGYKITAVLESSTVDHLLPELGGCQNDSGVDEEFDAEDEKQDVEPSESGSAVAATRSIFSSNSGSRDEEDPPVVKESHSDSGEDETTPANWLGFPTMSDSLRDKLTFRKKIPRFYKRSLNVTTETDLFATYFCPDRVDPNALAPVTDSVACSFREGTELLPSHYGRVFVSDARLVFVGWSGKQLALGLTDEFRGVESVADPLSGSKDTLQITFKKLGGAQEQLPVFVGGLEDQREAMDLIERARERAVAKANELAEERRVAEQTEAGKTVPLDTTLPKMEVVLRKHLRNLSIQRFYEIVWAEGEDTKEAPLLRPWLEQECLDVEVGDWEYGEFIGPWCNEKYQQKRIVQFKVKRKTHLYIGPPIASVTQTQHCRLEKQDKCVMAMTVDCEGIPYADTFSVEVRWVARREGESDVCVETGLFVNLKKNSMFAKQIRSGTTEEATAVAKDMFACIKKACLAAGGDEVEEVTDETEAENLAAEPAAKVNPSQLVRSNLFPLAVALFAVFFWRFWSFRSEVISANAQGPFVKDVAYLGERIDQLETEVKLVRQTLDEILHILKNQN